LENLLESKKIVLPKVLLQNIVKDYILIQRNQIIEDMTDKFLLAYIKDNMIWPNKPDIPTQDIMALHKLLELKGLPVEPSLFYLFDDKSMISLRLHNILFDKFEKNFMDCNPNLNHKSSEADWITAYVDTFEHNRYEDYFNELAAKKGINFGTDLQMLINHEISRQTELRRIERIENAITNQSKLIKATTIDDIDSISGLEFEHLLEKLFENLGFKVMVTKASGDQGGDLIIEKFGEKTVVQAKRYTTRISNSAVQEVVAAKAFYGCPKAMVVTNSYFTKSARLLAEANQVELWDRDILLQKIDALV
jgi:hemerythrin-like domain-containing protein